MKRIIRLTESDLTRIVRRVIMEQNEKDVYCKEFPEKVVGTYDESEQMFYPNEDYEKIYGAPGKLPSGCSTK